MWINVNFIQLARTIGVIFPQNAIFKEMLFKNFGIFTINFGVVKKFYSWANESLREDFKEYGLITQSLFLFAMSKYYSIIPLAILGGILLILMKIIFHFLNWKILL